MKHILVIIALSIFLFGCNMNPSKEARIQKLETETLQSVEKIKQLENKVEALENSNEQLKTRVSEIENRR